MATTTNSEEKNPTKSNKKTQHARIKPNQTNANFFLTLCVHSVARRCLILYQLKLTRIFCSTGWIGDQRWATKSCELRCVCALCHSCVVLWCRWWWRRPNNCLSKWLYGPAPISIFPKYLLIQMFHFFWVGNEFIWSLELFSVPLQLKFNFITVWIGCRFEHIFIYIRRTFVFI